jgi:NAD(P)-dependent dehydrogenase (short-subunit alcohol dehydrogenase family)
MPDERSVLITGASTGIGRACALHMDNLGWRVFAGVRKDADARALRKEGSSRLTPVRLDVADPRSIRQTRDTVRRAVGEAGLSGLVNNAGIAYGGPVELLDLKELRKTFDVNFFGLIEVTQAFLPLLRAGRGRVVNMSSVSGMVASPFLSPYTTSKWALEALSDAMRVELHPWGIEVSVVRPGAINTPIWAKGRVTGDRILKRAPKELGEYYGPVVKRLLSGIKPHGISAESVAEAVAHALTASHPRARYNVGASVAVVEIFRRLPDRVRDWIFLRRLRSHI